MREVVDGGGAVGVRGVGVPGRAASLFQLVGFWSSCGSRSASRRRSA
jgi:hypothetical protein